jgi:hypothetical protein
VAVRVGAEPFATCETLTAWSHNGKWRGTNSRATITVTRRCLEALGCELVIGGMLTLDAERVGPRAFRAVWAEQSRGLGLKVVHGSLIRGYHSTASTFEKASQEA